MSYSCGELSVNKCTQQNPFSCFGEENTILIAAVFSAVQMYTELHTLFWTWKKRQRINSGLDELV